MRQDNVWGWFSVLGAVLSLGLSRRCSPDTGGHVIGLGKLVGEYWRVARRSGHCT